MKPKHGLGSLLMALAFIVTGCGGDEESTATSTSSADAAETTTTAATATTVEATTTAPATSTTAGGSSSLREMRADLGIGSVVLQPAEEGGPHPTLQWDPVAGAASYWLVLHDDSGEIYWAWTGAESQVRVGGGDSAELNQTAALYEPMSWAVSAFDGSGNLIALSDVATVSP